MVAATVFALFEAGSTALGSNRVTTCCNQRARRIDLVGMALATLGLAALLPPLVESRRLGWPAWTWSSLIAASVLLGALGAHQRWLAGRGGSLLLDPALFGIGTLRASLVTQLSF